MKIIHSELPLKAGRSSRGPRKSRRIDAIGLKILNYALPDVFRLGLEVLACCSVDRIGKMFRRSKLH
jgi:hypothetical protein